MTNVFKLSMTVHSFLYLPEINWRGFPSFRNVSFLMTNVRLSVDASFPKVPDSVLCNEIPRHTTNRTLLIDNGISLLKVLCQSSLWDTSIATIN